MAQGTDKRSTVHDGVNNYEYMHSQLQTATMFSNPYTVCSTEFFYVLHDIREFERNDSTQSYSYLLRR